MKAMLTRQGLLKALLFLALAANVSWDPLMKKFNSTDLAMSDAISATGEESSPPAAPIAEEPAKNAPAATSGKPAGGEKPAAAAPAPKPAPAKAAEVVHPSHQETQKFCGREFVVTYEEKEISGRLRTEIMVERPTAGQFDFVLVRLGSLKDVMAQKTKVDSDIRAELALKDKSCQETVAEKPAPRKDPRRDSSGDERRDREDASRLARDIQDCLVDAKSHDELKEAERISCLVDRLRHVKSDHRNERQAAGDVMTKIERIVRDQLSKALKAAIICRDTYRTSRSSRSSSLSLRASREDERSFCSDPDKIEAAVERVEDVLSALETLESRYSLADYQAGRIAKVKNQLRGIQDGGTFVAKTVEPREEMRQLREEMRDALDDVYRNPRDLQAISRLNQIRSQHLSLDAQISRELRGPWQTLVEDQRMGWLSTADMQVFQSPYQQLLSDMRSITDPCLSPLAASAGARCLPRLDASGRISTSGMPYDIDTPYAPNDFLTYRRGAQRGQPGALSILSPTANRSPFVGNQGLSFPPQSMVPGRTMTFAPSPLPTGAPYSPNTFNPNGFNNGFNPNGYNSGAFRSVRGL
jgi:hypothetical protein